MCLLKNFYQKRASLTYSGPDLRCNDNNILQGDDTIYLKESPEPNPKKESRLLKWNKYTMICGTSKFVLDVRQNWK